MITKTLSNTTSKSAWMMWFVATCFVLFQFILQMSPGVMTEAWMHDFGANQNSVSYLSASLYYSYLILQIPAGLLFDRYGPKRVLTIAAGCLGAGCIWLAFSTTYLDALLARTLMGVGCTFAFIGMLCLVAIWFPHRLFALMIGLSETLAMIITAIGTTGFAYLVTHFTWRFAMTLSAVFAWIVMLAVLFIVRDNPQPTEKPPHLPVRTQLWRVLRNRQVILAGVYGFCSFGFINVFGALWGEPYFMTVRQYPLSLAAGSITFLLLGVATGGPLFSWWCSQIGKRKPVLLAGMVMAWVMFAGLLYIPHVPLLLGYLFLYVIGIGSSGYIIAFAVAKENTDSQVRGTAMAVTNFITMISAPILQSIVGWLLQNHIFGLARDLSQSFTISLSLLLVFFVVGMITALSLRETHCRSL